MQRIEAVEKTRDDKAYVAHSIQYQQLKTWTWFMCPSWHNYHQHICGTYKAIIYTDRTTRRAQLNIFHHQQQRFNDAELATTMDDLRWYPARKTTLRDNRYAGAMVRIKPERTKAAIQLFYEISSANFHKNQYESAATR